MVFRAAGVFGCLVCALVLGAAPTFAATPQIAIGEAHVLVLHADGSVWAWGRNDRGQVGDGTTLDRALPVRVAGISNAVSVATHKYASFAVLADGTVRAWGRNDVGQLGDGTRVDRLAPVRVLGAANVVSVAAGDAHGLALRSDGTVLGWGSNSFGCVGDGTTTDRLSAVAVSGLANVRTVRAGSFFSLAVTNDGTVWTWGRNDLGALGSSDPDFVWRTLPGRVDGVPFATGPAAAGDFHAVVVVTGGAVWGWGSNQSRQLGPGRSTGPMPAPVTSVPGANALASAFDFNLATNASGTLFAWGAGGRGQLGGGTTPFVSANPVNVQGITSPMAFAAGQYNGGAIAADGSVQMWGDNSNGQLGDGTLTFRSAPVHVIGPSGGGIFSATASNNESNHAPSAVFSATPSRGTAPVTVSLDAGASSDQDGSIVAYEWSVSNGATASGRSASITFAQAGHHVVTLKVTDDRGAFAFAQRTLIIESAINLAATATPQVVGRNASTTLALASDSSVRSWGSSRTLNGNGPGAGARSAPQLVDDLTGVTFMSMNAQNACAVKADGTLWMWGQNQFGQLGDGTTLRRDRPTQVPGLANVKSVTCAGAQTIALQNDGTVWSWGRSVAGETALGDFQTRATPTRVTSISGVAAVSGSTFYTLFLKSDGTVWGSGDGNAINGVDDSFTTPVQVPNLTSIRAIAAGDDQNLALRNDGTVWFWSGEATTITPRSASPTQVSGIDGAIAIATSGDTFGALRNDGTVWIWGTNTDGQLGNGARDDGNPRPAQVAGLRDIVAIDAGVRSFAIDRDGFLYGWGTNELGVLGDGTYANRLRPQLVAGDGGNGFLRLKPGNAPPPADKVPVISLLASAASDGGVGGNVDVILKARAQDVGTTQNFYVFALAPASRVKRLPGTKDDSNNCVIAQPDPNGNLVQTSSSNVQPVTTGTVTQQGQSMNIARNTTPDSAGGATMCAGYGTSPQAMMSNGTYRAGASVPGSSQCPDTCVAPNTPAALSGLWWNANESGWGIHVTQRRETVFAAWYTYDASGNPKWYVSTCAMPAGTTGTSGTCNGQVLEVSGPTFFGTTFNPSLAHIASNGNLQLSFANADSASMTYTGVAGQSRVVPITRQPLQSGTTSPAINYTDIWWAGQNESGWGMAITQQFSTVFLAWYVYDGTGKPMWYVATCMLSGTTCAGPVLRTTGPAFGPTFNSSQVQVSTAGTISVTFTDANNATLTYTVNGVSGTKNITRQAF